VVINLWASRPPQNSDIPMQPRPSAETVCPCAPTWRYLIDPFFVITHRLPLQEAPLGYEIFGQMRDNCIKVVLKP
jgi:hypothetical protein